MTCVLVEVAKSTRTVVVNSLTNPYKIRIYEKLKKCENCPRFVFHNIKMWTKSIESKGVNVNEYVDIFFGKEKVLLRSAY